MIVRCCVVCMEPAGGCKTWSCGVMGTAVGLHDTVVWCAWCQQVAMGHGVVVRLATSNICKALRCQVWAAHSRGCTRCATAAEETRQAWHLGSKDWSR